jgi:K319-like protein
MPPMKKIISFSLALILILGVVLSAPAGLFLYSAKAQNIVNSPKLSMLPSTAAKTNGMPIVHSSPSQATSNSGNIPFNINNPNTLNNLNNHNPVRPGVSAVSPVISARTFPSVNPNQQQRQIGRAAAPIPNAGVSQTVYEGTTVKLDGSKSYDPNPGGTIINYRWLQTSGIPVMLLGSENNPNPTFVAPRLPTTASTVLTFSLTVTDNFGLTSIIPSTTSVIVAYNAQSHSTVLNSSPITQAPAIGQKEQQPLLPQNTFQQLQNQQRLQLAPLRFHNTLPFLNLGQHPTTKTSSLQNSTSPKIQAIQNNNTHITASHINNTPVRPTNDTIGLARPKALAAAVGPQSNNITSFPSNSSSTTPNTQSSTKVSSSTHSLTSVTGSQFSGTSDYKNVIYEDCGPDFANPDVCKITQSGHMTLSGTLTYLGKFSGLDTFVPTPGEQMGTCDTNQISEDTTQGTSTVFGGGTETVYGYDPSNSSPSPGLQLQGKVEVDSTKNTMGMALSSLGAGGLCGGLDSPATVPYSENNGVASASGGDSISSTQPPLNDPTLPNGPITFSNQWSASVVLPPCDPTTQSCPPPPPPPVCSSTSALTASANTATQTQPNCPPVAIALCKVNSQPMCRVNSGSLVELDGSTSTPAGQITFRWTPDATTNAPQLTNPNTANPTFKAIPYVDKETTYRYQLIVHCSSCPTPDSAPSFVDVTVLPLIVSITTSRDQIDPYGATNGPPGNAQAQLTVTVKNLDGQPVPNENVRIRACTQPSELSGDGREDVDTRSATDSACQPGVQKAGVLVTRPAAFLNDQGHTPVAQPIVNNLVQGITRQTNAQGQILMTYESPKYFIPATPAVPATPGHPGTPAHAARSFYISGQDDVNGSLAATEDNNLNSHFFARLSITTRVLDTHHNNAPLQPLANSQPDNCPSPGVPPGIVDPVYPQTGNYFFLRQHNHACKFYGTQDTNNAIMNIATQFLTRQVTCSQNGWQTNADCLVHEDPNGAGQINTIHVHITTTGVPFRIEAMSLPWGGLLDIGPGGESPCTSNGMPCQFWHSPHAAHNNGKVIDISFKNRDEQETPMSREHKLLLREVIMQNTNFRAIVPCEGGINLVTPKPSCHTPAQGNFPELATHIHASFRN